MRNSDLDQLSTVLRKDSLLTLARTLYQQPVETQVEIL